MNMPAQSIDFAISHNREDLQAAVELLHRLESGGLTGWIDARAFYSPLVAAEGQIERAFQRACRICLYVGDAYRDSAWCREEYRYALRSERALSITRVCVVAHSCDAAALVPAELGHAPGFVLSRAGDIEACGALIAGGRRDAARLAEWHMRERSPVSGLLGQLPVPERIKLIADHMTFLYEHFLAGTIDPVNHASALALGLTAGPPGAVVGHASPALLMEMSWRWVSAVVGERRLRKFLDGRCEAAELPLLYIVDIRRMVERVLPVFHAYLEVAARRRGNATGVTEAEMLAIVNDVVCGFLAVLSRANQCGKNVTDGVEALLALIAQSGDGRTAGLADVVQSCLPAIGLPETGRFLQMAVWEALSPSGE